MRTTHTHHGRLSRIAAAATLALALLLVLPAAARAASCPTSSVEYQFGKLVNDARAARGMRRLAIDTQLNKVSSYHAYEMKRADNMYHTSLTTLGRRIVGWYSIGENIGYLNGATDISASTQARTMFRMFMNSPAHRANILKSSSYYRYQGIGITYDAGGTLWITHTFSGRIDPGTSVTSSVCS